MRKLIFALILCPLWGFSQNVVLDKIVGVVGENIIMRSDVEQQYLYLTTNEGLPKDPSFKCQVFEDILFQKLLLNQARLDSVEVDAKQVEAELDKRINYYLNSPLFNGDVKKFEAYYGKSMSEIKEDFRKNINDQMLSQQVQSKITADVKVSPNDINRFYNSIPKDSLPLMNSEVEIGQIIKKPKVSDAEKNRIRDFLRGLREEIKDDPTQFAVKALIYSQDEGSRVKGGELGFVSRDMLVPEFASVAFSLKDKNCSEVVETEYGFHIIQLIERRGETINVRHILIAPEILPADLQAAERFLDSLGTELQKPGAMPFPKAAELYSDDVETKKNGGMMMNPMNNSTRFDLLDLNKIDPTLFFTIDKMNQGDISKPIVIKSKDDKSVAGFRLVYLKLRTKPHVISIKDDYQKLQALAEADKKKKAIAKWIAEKKAKTYVKIDSDYINCNFQNNWNN